MLITLKPQAVCLDLKSPPIKKVFSKEDKSFVKSLEVNLEDGGQYTDDMVVGIWLICIAMLVACTEIL